jgi:murein DD-endopeptidase MepM/ murein hydrolase activator NlpD
LIVGEAYANTEPGQANNWQNIALSAESSIPLFQNKDGRIDSSVDIHIVSEKALLPTATPIETQNATGGGDFSFEGETEIYVVRPGDTADSVAKLFGVSVDTILSANEMKKGDKLQTGDVLLILPFSGVEHTVAKGETLHSIASKYKVDLDDILHANDLEGSSKLAIGDKLMIPGGNISNDTKPKSSGSSGPGTGKGGSSSGTPSVAGYFKNPVPGAKRTRGITSKHRGVDLAAPAGTPIHAAASGIVIIARNGYNGGFGNYVVIQHPNGAKTLYAHMSKLGTTPGAQVTQGEVIGYVGNTGNSRGDHLHIEVLGAKNPF